MAQFLKANRKTFKYGIRTSGQHQSQAGSRESPQRQKSLMANASLHATSEDIEQFRRQMRRA